MLHRLFYVLVTVHRNKFLFNKTNRRTNFPKLVRSSILVVLESCHQTCMTYISAECTVENS